MDRRDYPFHPFHFRGKVLYRKTLTYSGVGAELIKNRLEPEDKPNLVLIHGLGNSWSFWLESSKLYEQAFNIYVFNLPWNCNYSCSFKSLKEVIDWLSVIFQLAQIENPVVLAHSYGASLMLNLVLQAQPGIVSKQILCSIFWPPRYTDQIWRFRREHFIKNFGNFICTGVVASMGYKETDNEIVGNVCDKVLLKIDKGIVLGYWDLLFNSCSPRIKTTELKIPTLLINGSKDSVVPVCDSAMLSCQIKDAEYICLDNVDHFPMVERKEIFYDNICRFCLGKVSS